MSMLSSLPQPPEPLFRLLGLRLCTSPPTYENFDNRPDSTRGTSDSSASEDRKSRPRSGRLSTVYADLNWNGINSYGSLNEIETPTSAAPHLKHERETDFHGNYPLNSNSSARKKTNSSNLVGIAGSRFRFKAVATHLRSIAIIASLCGAVQGYLMTMSQLLMTNDQFLSTVAIDSYDNNPWSFFPRFIALFYVGEMLGALLAFPFSDGFGRKYTLIYASIGCICMLVWCTVTESGANVLSSRFCMGWCMGVLVATAPVYISEISVDESRGQHIALLALAMTVGSFLSCVVYAMLWTFPFGWRLSLLVPILILSFEVIILVYLPDSPRWLLASKTPAECLTALRQLRLKTDVDKEFNGIYRALTSDAKLGDSWGDLFIVSKSVRIRMLLCLFIQVQQQMVGAQLVIVYGFDTLHNTGLQSRIYIFLLSGILAGVFGTALFCKYADTLGRRQLLMTGCACISIAWIGAAIGSYWGGSTDDDTTASYTATSRLFFEVCICLYSFGFSLSVGPMAWVFPSEIFPYRARAKASSVSAAFHFFVALVGSGVLKVTLKDQYRKSGCFLFFSLLSSLSLLVVYAAIPETKGVMLEDMEELFRVDPKAYCCGCLPELNSGLLGLRVLHESQKALNKLVANTSDSRGVGHGSSVDPVSDQNSMYVCMVEPSTLHKYSNYMRETKFLYFEENEEDEELFVPSLFGSSSQTTPQSQHHQHQHQQQPPSSSSTSIARFSTSSATININNNNNNNSNNRNNPSSYDHKKGYKRSDS